MSHLEQLLPQSEEREFWSRILLRTPPSPKQRVWEDATRSIGFVHVWSTSGIHLWALASGVAALLRTLLRRFTSHAGWLARGGGLLACFIAWLLADCPWGMLRPAIPILARHAALYWGVRWRFWSPLALALCMEGCGALLSQGSLHYGLAVGGGLTALELCGKDAPGFRKHAAMAVGSWIPLALLDISLRGWSAILTPIWSLLSIPLLAQIAFPIGLALLAFPLTPGGGAFLHSIHRVLDSFFEWGFALPSAWHVRPLVVGIGVITAALSHIFARQIQSSTFQRAIVTLTLGVLILCARSTVHLERTRGAFAQQISQLNVGQGDAALIAIDRFHAPLLLDAGPPNGILLSKLWDAWPHEHPAQLSALALTHRDRDHRGGVAQISRWLNWDCVVTPEQITRSTCPLPGAWGWIHNPRRNGTMLGAWIPLENAAYLNLGDADLRGEEELWGLLKPQINKLYPGVQPERRILKVSHHGSKTSTGLPILTEFAPTEAWISAGRHNTYGHPHPQTLLKLRLKGIPWLSTQENQPLAIPY